MDGKLKLARDKEGIAATRCPFAGGVICAMQISVDTGVFLDEAFRKLAGTGDQRFVIGDAVGGCGGLRVASTL